MNLSSKLKQVRWRWVLAASQFVLAVALSLMLNAELKAHNAQLESHRVPGWGLMEFDYLPSTLNWMVILDFPAIVAVALFGMAHASPTVVKLLFPVFPGLFWCWFGRGMERRLMRVDGDRKPPGFLASILNGGGLAGAFAPLIAILWARDGATPLVLVASMIGWCLAFVAYFATHFARRWQSDNGPAAKASHRGASLNG